MILGLPAFLIVLTAHRWSYVLWMFIYLASLPIWNFVLPVYSFWKFDDFSWGDTRKVEGEVVLKSGHDDEGEFDSTKITMRRWCDFERGKLPVLCSRNGKMHANITVQSEELESPPPNGRLPLGKLATLPRPKLTMITRMSDQTSCFFLFPFLIVSVYK